MEKFKGLINWLWSTKLGKALSCGILAFCAFGLEYKWEWMYYVGLALLIYPVGLTCVLIVYGWIINPIRDRRADKKARLEYELKEKEAAITLAEKPVEKTDYKSPGISFMEQDFTVISTKPKVVKKVAKKIIDKKITKKRK